LDPGVFATPSWPLHPWPVATCQPASPSFNLLIQCPSYILFIFVYMYVLVVLGLELRASCLVGRFTCIFCSNISIFTKELGSSLFCVTLIKSLSLF
jgi:hypothetical protein